MAYIPEIKDTLLIPSGTVSNPNARHLFAIITARCAYGHHLMVSVSRIIQGRYHDPSCVLEAGVHEFIKAPSFVRYETARIVDAAHLTTCVDNGSFVLRAPIPDHWLKRMHDGLAISDRVKPRIWNYFNGGPP
jgi:hypothetical protein